MTHVVTEEVMVMKELIEFHEELENTIQNEVNGVGVTLKRSHSVFFSSTVNALTLN